MKKLITVIIALLLTVLSAACSKGKNAVEISSENSVFDWGITLTAENVTAEGLTLVCAQAGGDVSGELNIGEDYFLEVKTENGWEKVPTVLEEYAWNSIAYIVNMNDETRWEINWNWLYGALESGNYRIGKEFMNFRAPGDYDKCVFYAEFEV